MLREFGGSASIRAASAASITPSSPTAAVQRAAASCGANGTSQRSGCWAARPGSGRRRILRERRACCTRLTSRSPTATAVRPSSTDVSLAIERGALVGPARPERLRQDDAAQAARAASLRAAAGRVTLDGRPLGDWPRREVARHIAVVPQETHRLRLQRDGDGADGRYPHLGPSSSRAPTDLAIARDALEPPARRTSPTRRYMTLSGGEKQRVVIASALAQATEHPAARRADGVARSRLPARNRSAAHARSTATAA